MREKGRRHTGLADFLRNRRARLRPERFDLPPYQRRQVPDRFIYPARVFDRCMNVMAWNEGANRGFGDHASCSEREHCALWLHFMHSASRKLPVHWEREARRCTAYLHAYDQYPDDRRLTGLIADLQQVSPEHAILLDCGPLFEIDHPQPGRLALHPTILTMPEASDLQLAVYTPLAQEDTAARLRALLTGEASA